MYVPLKVTTDYSLLQSLIKIDSLILYLKDNNIKSCAICDDYLYGSMEFYNKCLKNNIKPIIGLDIFLNNNHIYLYAKNYNGYQNLLKLNSIKTERDLGIADLKLYRKDIICITSTDSYDIYKEIYETFIGFSNDYEYKNALIKTDKVVYVKNIKALRSEDINFLKYIDMIRDDKNVLDYKIISYENNYLEKDINPLYAKTTLIFAEKINLEILKNKNYIPKYIQGDSNKYLVDLSYKGLNKRFNNIVPQEYKKRLDYELSVINNMGFADYILIVYDYVLYSKKHNILVGPGRGSAAGSLICYCLGITDIDPLKYNLLFERFLNKDRVTMPDIDIDFENTKRGEVINYLKNKYGRSKVASIMTFATLKSKLAIRDVAKIFNYTNKDLDYFLKNVDANKTLRENYQNSKINKYLRQNKKLFDIYKIATKLEGIKKNISTHAAGVVISSINLDEIIPIISNSDIISTGVTMEYLEDLGLLKMDLLAIKNLTMIANILDLIKKDTNKSINLNKIPLNDKEVLNLFSSGNTTGIFQFESTGMISFLEKLKPTSFNDLVLALALYRPGPMDNINLFIKRRNGLLKVDYIIPDLKQILDETNGIIVYQEQVMQVLRIIGGFTFTEADIIRRAMSKKKEEVIKDYRKKFIDNAVKKGYKKNDAEKVYDLILKFASFGFNKSHSVAYAIVGYQMAYLKVKFFKYFIINLLNMNISSVTKTNEYILEAKSHNMLILKPNINKSQKEYYIENNTIILPMSIIKGISNIVIENIVLEREENGLFIDFIDFVKRMYKKVNKKILESLIKAGVFDDFNNKTTLFSNLDAVLNYAEVASDIEEPLILKPIIKESIDNSNNIEDEVNSYGFFISNHPVSVYKGNNIIKIRNINNYFDKYVKTVVLIESIKSLKNKNNEAMAFLTGSDETGSLTFVVFHKQIGLIDNLGINEIVEIQGRVAKRFDKYQINVNNLIRSI